MNSFFHKPEKCCIATAFVVLICLTKIINSIPLLYVLVSDTLIYL